MGDTLDRFHLAGKIPLLRDSLKIMLSGAAKTDEQFFKMIGWIPSGPGPFFTLIFFISSTMKVESSRNEVVFDVKYVECGVSAVVVGVVFTEKLCE